MSQAVEHILEEVRGLSLEEQVRLREALNAQSTTATPSSRSAAEELFGKYAHAPTSSAEFSARKAAEMLEEEHS